MFDIVKTEQVVAQQHHLQTKIGFFFTATGSVLKISNIGGHQKMRHPKR